MWLNASALTGVPTTAMQTWTPSFLCAGGERKSRACVRQAFDGVPVLAFLSQGVDKVRTAVVGRARVGMATRSGRIDE